MRVVITSLPGHGHLGPLIPLAVAIRDAGHDVAFATSATFGKLLEEHGLPLEPCGPLWREADFGRNFQQPQLLGDLAKFLDTEVTSRVLNDIDASVTRARPDLILSNDFEPNGRVIAERAGIPFVLASSGPRMPRAFRERLQGNILAASRRAGGLGEKGALDYTLRWLHLHFSPVDHALETAAEGAAVEARNEFGVRPAVAEFGAPFEPRGGMSGDTSRPAALCTFGTVFNKDPEILRTVINAVAPRVRRLFVLLGPGIDAESLGALPVGVELHSDVALSTMLPHVDYVVTHGGTASLAAIQLHAKPCLLLPLGADQIINGAACQRRRLGVVRFHTIAAVMVGAQPIMPMTQDSVGEAFDELTADEGYVARAADFKRTLHAMPPMQSAVPLLERLAVTRAPVLRQP